MMGSHQRINPFVFFPHAQTEVLSLPCPKLERIRFKGLKKKRLIMRSNIKRIWWLDKKRRWSPGSRQTIQKIKSDSIVMSQVGNDESTKQSWSREIFISRAAMHFTHWKPKCSEYSSSRPFKVRSISFFNKKKLFSWAKYNITIMDIGLQSWGY